MLFLSDFVKFLLYKVIMSHKFDSFISFLENVRVCVSDMWYLFLHKVWDKPNI
jgi:hypothetical protein